MGQSCSILQPIYFDVVRGLRPEHREQWCTPVYTKVVEQERSEVFD